MGKYFFYLALNSKVCENSDVLKVLYFIGQILKIMFFIVPILLILLLVIDFVKNVIANNADNMQKNFNLALKRIIMTVCLFFVPTIVNFLIVLVDAGDIGYADCIVNANLDTIAGFKMKEELDVTNDVPSRNDTILDLTGGNSGFNVSNGTTSSVGKGKGKVLDVDIKYNVKDKKGRCGKGSGDYCAAVATVKYATDTVKYYVGYQNNSGLLIGSCRSHAFMSVVNAIKGTTYSTLDLQKYLYSTGDKGVIKAKGFPKAIKKYGINATVYHSELSKEKAAKLMKEALDNGQPVMIFVANSLCSDIAGSHHALLVLGYDDNGNAIFVDSVPYSKNAKKRTLKELSQCISGNSISDGYYRMIIFSFD